MNIIKKIFMIISIVIILQTVNMVFTNNYTYATSEGENAKKEETEESFFEKVFSSGSQWEEMKGDGADLIEKSSEGVEKATSDIYNAVRLIGFACLLGVIVFASISYSLKGPEKKAESKKEIVIIVIVAILFLFAGPIFEKIQKLLETIEGTMKPEGGAETIGSFGHYFLGLLENITKTA